MVGYVVRRANGRLFWKQKTDLSGLWVQRVEQASVWDSQDSADRVAQDMGGYSEPLVVTKEA